MKTETTKKTKKNCKLWGVIVALMLAFTIGGCGGSADTTAIETPTTEIATEATNEPTTETPETIDEVAESEPISEPEPTDEPVENDNLTMGQKNALKSAQSYLDYSAFSYSGLIGQLEYEGYTTEEATFAVDNCNADWNEQAVKSAQSYLEYSSFSKTELIGQLEYEGYTTEQAEYAVSQVGF